MPTAMREPISVNRRLCSSVKRPASCASRFSTPMTRFLTISGTASSERTSVNDRDVFGMLGNVIHQDGFTPLRRHSGDALADLDLDSLGDFTRVSNLKADAQVLGLFVHQQDGKDFVVDDFAHQFGHAAQRGVQIEGGVDHVRHFKQKRLDFQLIGLGSCSSHESL